jgi:ParB family transcriptional regulator, chromosome partitioning protein
MTPTRTEPTAEQEEEIKTLTAKAEGIVAEHGDEPADEAAFNELASALNRIEELSAGEQVWTLEQKAVSGVLVTIGHSGELQIKRGLIKPEDKAAARKVQGVTREAQDEKPKPAKEKGGLSAALVAEVTSHKTAAARLELANNANVALLAVTHALALRAFYNPYDQHTSLKIVAHETTFPMAINEQIEKSTAGNKFATTVKAWRKKLPKEPGEVAPVSWTSDYLCSRSPQWPRQEEPTHLSSVARWWNWCVLAAHLRNWRMSSNRRRSRSGIGWRSGTATPVAATAA